MFAKLNSRRWKIHCGKCHHFPRCFARTPNAWFCWRLELADSNQSTVESSRVAFEIFAQWMNSRQSHILPAFFWILELVILSSSHICQSLKAPSDIFVGLPERGRFATELLILNFLTIPMTLAILTSKPSAFNDPKISAGSRPCLWRSSIRNFHHDSLQMVWKRMLNIMTLGLVYKVNSYHGSEYNRSKSHVRTQETVVMEHKCNVTVLRLGFNLETLCVYTQLKLRFSKQILLLAWFAPLLDCGITFPVYPWRVSR